MNNESIEIFLMTHQNHFPAEKMPFLREKLLSLPEERAKYIIMTELKDPTTILLVSLFLGGLGVDRFMLGDVGLGVLKLLTGGVCGIMTIIDWITTLKRTKEKNFDTIWKAISMAN